MFTGDKSEKKDNDKAERNQTTATVTFLDVLMHFLLGYQSKYSYSSVASNSYLDCEQSQKHTISLRKKKINNKRERKALYKYEGGPVCLPGSFLSLSLLFAFNFKSICSRSMRDESLRIY